MKVARQLGELGMTVLVGARDLERGQRAAAELGAQGVDAVAPALDVADPAGVASAARRVAELGRLEVLVKQRGDLPRRPGVSTPRADSSPAPERRARA